MEQWNHIILGGENSNKSSEKLVNKLDIDDNISFVRVKISQDKTIIYITSKTYTSRFDIYYVLINNLKSIDILPEWAIVVNGNEEDKSGSAWILQNYRGYMDIIDIAVGRNKLYGIDVEEYILKEHDVSVPIWLPEIPDENMVIEVNIENKNKISDGILEESIKNFPQFDIQRKISSNKDSIPIEKRTANPSDENRSVTLTDAEFDILQEMIQEYTVINEEQFISKNFNNTTFTGTWDEFTNTFWNALDDIISGVEDFDIPDSEVIKVKKYANNLKWQSTIDWHKLSNDESIKTTTRS